MPEPTKVQRLGMTSRWQPIATAPKNWPVLVVLHSSQREKRDGQHGPMQVAANRGMGWISIPGMWACRPTHWMPLPAPPCTEDRT